MVFYITKKNDPTYLLSEIKVPIRPLLITGKFTAPLEISSEFSIYTKKIFRFYQYNIKTNNNKRNTIGRVNNLVAYETSTNLAEVYDGLLAIYNVATQHIEVKLMEKSYDLNTNKDVITLYITNEYDPNILITSVTIDKSILLEGNTAYYNIGELTNFSIVSYPYTDNLTFYKNNGN